MDQASPYSGLVPALLKNTAFHHSRTGCQVPHTLKRSRIIYFIIFINQTINSWISSTGIRSLFFMLLVKNEGTFFKQGIFQCVTKQKKMHLNKYLRIFSHPGHSIFRRCSSKHRKHKQGQLYMFTCTTPEDLNEVFKLQNNWKSSLHHVGLDTTSGKEKVEEDFSYMCWKLLTNHNRVGFNAF